MPIGSTITQKLLIGIDFIGAQKIRLNTIVTEFDNSDDRIIRSRVIALTKSILDKMILDTSFAVIFLSTNSFNFMIFSANVEFKKRYRLVPIKFWSVV